MQFEATAWTGEIFPILNTVIKCQVSSILPSGSEQHTPNLACCERLKIEIFFLDKNHLHFFQVQTGMAISGLKTSHFVTYTSKRIFIVAINFNDKFWETVAAPVYKFH